MVELIAELRSEVRQLAETHQDDASGITWFAEVSANKVSRSQTDAELAEPALPRVKFFVRGLEESHPVLVAIQPRASFQNTCADLLDRVIRP